MARGAGRKSAGGGQLSTQLGAACKARLTRLRQELTRQKLDGLLVTNPKDARYFTTFNSKDCLLLVFGDGAALISDVRDEEAMQYLRGSGLAEPVIGTQHRLPETVRDVCRRNKVTRLALQGEHISLAARAAIAEKMDSAALVDTRGLVATLRMKKDSLELAAIKKAVGIHEAALKASLPELRLNMPELEFCALLEFEMRRRGAEGPSFGTMVASGVRSSMIHYATSMAPIGPGVLLVDMGAIADGYCSDMTRTFSLGPMPSPLREVYSIVLQAQRAAIAACRPGKTCAEVDAVARDIITDAGYGPQFGHGLGHGIGLDIHEAPRFNQLATDIVLESGMVMTVEPGIYLPGVGGVRIEDDVLITDDGCRVLTSFPKDLKRAELPAARTGRTVKTKRSGSSPRSGARRRPRRITGRRRPSAR